MSEPTDSIHFKVVVRDASDEAEALVDFEGEGIQPVTDESIVLDPPFQVFVSDSPAPNTDARRPGNNVSSVRSELPFYATKQELRTFGIALYQQLFSSENLLVGLAEAQQTGRQRQRPIRLSFENRDVARYADIPWETICHPGPPPEHLGDSTSVNIVRSVKGLSPLDASPEPEVVRVLIATASPDPSNPILIERELLALGEQINAAVLHSDETAKPMVFEWLAPLINTTKDLLVNALETHRPHIVHFIGHGSYDDGHGYLHLHSQMSPDQVVRVSASDLVTMMRDRRPELFVLNSCEGAVGGSGQFTGVAESLLKTQCARFVVAMQYPISNDAAIAFVKGFYPSLQRGETVDVAVTSGRNRIHVHELESVAVEFVTPTLYMNGSNGHLFDRKPESLPSGFGEVSSEARPTAPAAATSTITSSRPGWLVPVLATVVLLALIAAGAFVLTSGAPESVQVLRVTIENGDVDAARDALLTAQAECESGGCSEKAQQNVAEAASFIDQITQAQGQVSGGNWRSARSVLSSLVDGSTTQSITGGPDNHLDYLNESLQLIDTQLAAEAALRANQWNEAQRGFAEVRAAVTTSGAVLMGTEQLLGSVARDASASGEEYARARSQTERAITSGNFSLAEASMRDAQKVRPRSYADDPIAFRAQFVLSQIVQADESFERGNYDQAREAYLTVLGMPDVFESSKAWLPVKTHAMERLQSLSTLTEPPAPVGDSDKPAGASRFSDVSGERVPFATNSASISPKALQQIDQMVSVLATLGDDVKVQVIGRADARGSTTYNLALGARRAEAVAAAFERAGVSRSRVLVVSVGEQWADPTSASPEQLAADRDSVLRLVYPAAADVLFDVASTTVASDFNTPIEQLAGWLARYPTMNISVVGHTDSTGSAATNERIGLQRAEAVAQRLIAAGVRPARLLVSSAGETQPFKPHGPDNASINRRVDLVLYKATE